ncbi:Cytochrome P450 [Mycena venus]|uniref:Cytochrome P450 n=1 Tax=Mycena venus TaxID=2733690 RepID=A0A8H6Z1P1_9AGAR|nr:Cytochrome P450 [Mycena venus]
MPPLTAVIALCIPFVVLWSVRARRWAANLNGPPSQSFLLGNLLQLVAPETGRDWLLNASNKYGGVIKIKGLLNRPSLLVSDPLALHHILVKEPTVFEEWQAFTITNSLLFGDGLVATIGEQHRRQRKMLNPLFSLQHLRSLAPSFLSIAKELEQLLALRVGDDPQEIDITGASVSVLMPAAPFLPLLVRLGPARLRRRVVEMIPFRLIQKLKNIVDILAAQMEVIFREKQSLLKGGQSDKHDIMAVLLKANQNSSKSECMSDKELLGQMATLVFAATDTTSGAIARLLHLLSQHPEVQARLFEEMTSDERELNYETLASLPYLDAVIRETLRVYPTVPMMFRQTTADASLPLLHPIRGVDGHDITSVHVPKGTDVFINILGSNHLRLTWGQDASEWNPERWLAPLPETVTKNRSIAGVYSHMMTFLAGKRACIGFNFAQIEMKVVIYTLLRSFEFSLVPGKEIGWNMGLLMTPVLRGSDSIHSHMPLLVRKRK